jgi:entericidin B
VHGAAQARRLPRKRPAALRHVRCGNPFGHCPDIENPNIQEIHMRNMLAALLLATLALAGCNTVEGVGKDIERGGERLQDSAEKTRR